MRAVSNPRGTIAAEIAAQNPDLAQTIEECTGDHGLNEMIEDCMNESAAMLAATEEWHQKAQVAAAPATLGANCTSSEMPRCAGFFPSPSPRVRPMNPSGSPKRARRTIPVQHDTFSAIWALKHKLRLPSYDAALRHLLEKAAAGEE